MISHSHWTKTPRRMGGKHGFTSDEPIRWEPLSSRQTPTRVTAPLRNPLWDQPRTAWRALFLGITVSTVGPSLPELSNMPIKWPVTLAPSKGAWCALNCSFHKTYKTRWLQEVRQCLTLSEKATMYTLFRKHILSLSLSLEHILYPQVHIDTYYT